LNRNGPIGVFQNSDTPTEARGMKLSSTGRAARPARRVVQAPDRPHIQERAAGDAVFLRQAQREIGLEARDREQVAAKRVLLVAARSRGPSPFGSKPRILPLPKYRSVTRLELLPPNEVIAPPSKIARRVTSSFMIRVSAKAKRGGLDILRIAAKSGEILAKAQQHAALRDSAR
jgi:hypothetical protein